MSLALTPIHSSGQLYSARTCQLLTRETLAMGAAATAQLRRTNTRTIASSRRPTGLPPATPRYGESRWFHGRRRDCEIVFAMESNDVRHSAPLPATMAYAAQ
jgi:hypothetical protein